MVPDRAGEVRMMHTTSDIAVTTVGSTVIDAELKLSSATRRTEALSRRDRVRWDQILWAAHELRDQQMPSAAIHTVIVTDEPEIIRRYMELHRERLQERLMDEQAIAGDIERLLIEAIGWRERRECAMPRNGEASRRGGTPEGPDRRSDGVERTSERLGKDATTSSRSR